MNILTVFVMRFCFAAIPVFATPTCSILNEALAMESAHLYQAANEGADIDALRLSLDGDFDKFFNRIETDMKRLEFIENFDELAKAS